MKLRLRQLRNEEGLTQEQAGSIILVNQSMYSRYENEKLGLPINAAIAYAEYYGVSIDYLTGLTEDPLPYPARKKI